MSDATKALIETALASAHRAVWRAARYAESFSDQGLADDLYSIAAELGRVNNDLMRPGRPGRARVTPRA